MFGSVSLFLSSLLLACTAAAPVCAVPPAKGDTLYCDAGIAPIAEEEVRLPFISKRLEDSYCITPEYPKFHSLTDNDCGAVAGANILAYFDRFDEDLIPNHVSGTANGSSFSYNPADAATDALIGQLGSYMGIANGVTEQGFFDGLTRYCSEKGKTLQWNSLMKSGAVDFTQTTSAIREGDPVVLFVQGYNKCTYWTEGNFEHFTYDVYEGAHIMVAFGYEWYIYRLYLSPDRDQNYKYLKVSYGSRYDSDLYEDGLCNMFYKTQIDDACAIEII